MPYAPGIQDISGQLLAQGMLGAAQTRAQTAGNIGQFMGNFGSQILKNEQERQQAAGVITGFLNDPYYQQQIAQNPELYSASEKIKSGKAGLNDVKQFLGTLTTMQGTREQQAKMDQMQAQTQYNQALREQAIAAKAATDAATAERVRQNDIANQIFSQTKQLEDFEKMDMAGTPFSIEQADRFQQLRDNPFLQSARKGMQAGLDPLTAIRLGQSQETIDVRQQANEALAASREQERILKGEIAALKSRPRLEAGTEKMFEIDGKQIKAEWDGSRYIDVRTGAPIYIDEQVMDKIGNVMTRRGSLNPFIAKRYGIPMEQAPAMGGGMPWDTGGGSAGGAGGAGGAGEPDSFSPGAEVGRPKPAAKTIAIFNTEEEAQRAWERGEIADGQKITIGGRTGTWVRK